MGDQSIKCKPGKRRRVVCPTDLYGVTLLGRSEREVWPMPLGALLDQWEIYKQSNGLAKIKEEYHVDEIIPHII